MTNENLFLQALRKGETEKFLKGEGIYYAHNPFDNEHCHGIRLSGDANQFIKSEDRGAEIFCAEFVKFVDQLAPDISDLEHLLANITETIRLQKKGLMEGVTLGESSQTQISKSIIHYINKLPHDSQLDELIQMYLQQLEQLDSKFLASILRLHLTER